ncbi:hypothetical protein KDL44_08335 [bacterium]|nr:hypothetical protein [bacterium]
MKEPRDSSDRAGGRSAVPAYRQRLQQLMAEDEPRPADPPRAAGIHPEGLAPQHIRERSSREIRRDARLSEEIRLAPRRPGWQQMLAMFGIFVAVTGLLWNMNPPESVQSESSYERFMGYFSLGLICLMSWAQWLLEAFILPRYPRPPRD